MILQIIKIDLMIAFCEIIIALARIYGVYQRIGIFEIMELNEKNQKKMDKDGGILRALIDLFIFPINIKCCYKLITVSDDKIIEKLRGE